MPFVLYTVRKNVQNVACFQDQGILHNHILWGYVKLPSFSHKKEIFNPKQNAWLKCTIWPGCSCRAAQVHHQLFSFLHTTNALLIYKAWTEKMGNDILAYIINIQIQ